MSIKSTSSMVEQQIVNLLVEGSSPSLVLLAGPLAVKGNDLEAHKVKAERLGFQP